MARQEVEKRLTYEYMKEHYPEGNYFVNCPLGGVDPALYKTGASYSMRRKVDALAYTPTEIRLIEFKVWKPLDGIDKLPVYKSLVPLTPELTQWYRLPVKMILVTPRPTPPLLESAASMGIAVEVVSGGWIDDAVKRIEYLWTADGRQAMAERAKMRAWLGLQ
jgi:hypothetical protein